METGKKLFRRILLGLTCLSLINLLFTASMISLVGSIVILLMVLAMKKGEYELRAPLSVVLFLHAGVNLIGLITAAIAFLTDTQISLIAALWLFIHTIALFLFGLLLHRKDLITYLQNAPKPEKKAKKITFFRGGWRDL